MITSLRFGSGAAKDFTFCRSVKFKPGINLVVGPNGSGKSVTLAALSHRSRLAREGEKVSGIKFKGCVVTRLFDTERMNPHVMNGSMAMGSAAAMQLWFGSGKRSHGQCLTPLLTTGMDGEIKKTREKLKSGESLTMLLDEPESGLDLAALDEFVRTVKKWSRKVQFIIATHSPWVWLKLDAHFVVLGKDQNYVENTLKAWEKMWCAQRPHT